MNQSPTLSALVCTIDERIDNVIKLLPVLLEADEIVISHQITSNLIKPAVFKNPKIKYVTLDKKGVSRNRNNVLQQSTCDLFYMIDDDVDLVKGWSTIIKNSFNEYQTADIITYFVHGVSYPNTKARPVSKLRSLGKKSVEIAYKRKSILDSNLVFDERFGLGSTYASGEENIFLIDAIHKKLRIIEVPSIIGSHLHVTGSSILTAKQFSYKPYIFYRMFGYVGVLLAIVYFTYQSIQQSSLPWYKAFSILVTHSFFVKKIHSTPIK